MLKKVEEQPQNAEDPIFRIAIYSLLVNLSLVAIKLTLSFMAGSLALRADAVHSVVDVSGSTALILGLFISGRKTKSFPYGLYKVENVVSVMISILLFVTAYEIVREALTESSVAIPYSSWVLVAVAALIPVPFLFGTYELKVGRRFNSPSLIADGSQFRADVLTSSMVFFALLGQRFDFPLDRLAAGIIALFIVRSGWDILVSGMKVLLDASIDQSTLDRIRSVIEAEPAVSTLETVTGRNSGRYLFVEATVTFRITDLEKAHLTSEHIEAEIRRAVPNVDRVLIHYEPRQKTHLRYAVALASFDGRISRHFGESPYFALVDLDLVKGELRQEVVANPYHDLEKGRGLKVSRFLLGHKPDVVITKEDLHRKGPGYALADAGVETKQTEAEHLSELTETWWPNRNVDGKKMEF